MNLIISTGVGGKRKADDKEDPSGRPTKIAKLDNDGKSSVPVTPSRILAMPQLMSDSYKVGVMVIGYRRGQVFSYLERRSLFKIEANLQKWRELITKVRESVRRRPDALNRRDEFKATIGPKHMKELSEYEVSAVGHFDIIDDSFGLPDNASLGLDDLRGRVVEREEIELKFSEEDSPLLQSLHQARTERGLQFILSDRSKKLLDANSIFDPRNKSVLAIVESVQLNGMSFNMRRDQGFNRGIDVSVPVETKEPKESNRDAALRALTEELGVSQNMAELILNVCYVGRMTSESLAYVDIEVFDLDILAEVDELVRTLLPRLGADSFVANLRLAFDFCCKAAKIDDVEQRWSSLAPLVEWADKTTALWSIDEAIGALGIGDKLSQRCVALFEDAVRQLHFQGRAKATILNSEKWRYGKI